MAFILDQKNSIPLNCNGPSFDVGGKFGSTLLFDGTDDYLTTPNQQQGFIFGDGDFTIEFWLRPDRLTDGVYETLLSVWGNNGEKSWSVFKLGAAIQFYYTLNGSAILNALNGGALQQSAYQHVAITRSGATIYGFINGLQFGSYNIGSNSLFASQNPLELGITTVPYSYPFQGRMDEVRITKGIARYTANFTPPSTPFDSSDSYWSSVSMLLHMDSAPSTHHDYQIIANAIDLTNFYYQTPQPFTTPRRLAGVVKENGVAVGAGKRVVAFSRSKCEYIASCTTKADGSFEMAGLEDRTGNPEKLFVVAFDDDGVNPNYNAVIADQIEQEV